jgi:hypothetical protein
MTRKILRHFGMCDASGGIALSATQFIVGNDEDNVLRIFEATSSGKFVKEIDVTSYLKNLPDEVDKREADIEAAALLGRTIYWITSHGRSKRGRKRPARLNFFGLKISINGHAISSQQVGESYTKLIEDMADDKNLKQYNLKEAGRIAPKEKGGLNIEGLTATPNGSLLIGFRNPIPGGRALLVPLLNPAKVVQGNPATFGPPIKLDLAELGIRSIEYWADRNIYLIIAGSYKKGGKSRLYQWSGNPKDTPVEIKNVDLSSLNPEAIIVYPGIVDKVQILSDDGAIEHDGTECKKLPKGDECKQFRSVWITL